jgi:hypothetical protein
VARKARGAIVRNGKAREGREIVAYVVRDGKTPKKGLYCVAGSEESGIEMTTCPEEAYRWPEDPNALGRAQVIAYMRGGRVVGISVPGKLRQAKRMPRLPRLPRAAARKELRHGKE